MKQLNKFIALGLFSATWSASASDLKIASGSARIGAMAALIAKDNAQDAAERLCGSIAERATPWKSSYSSVRMEEPPYETYTVLNVEAAFRCSK